MHTDDRRLRRPAKTKVVVVSREQVFGLGRVALWAAIYSAAATLGTCTASRENAEAVLRADASGAIDPWMLVHAVFIVGVLTVAPIPWLYRHIPGWRVVAFGVIYALGLVAWKELVIIPLCGMGFRIPLVYSPGVAVLFLFTSHLAVCGFVGCCTAWLICRWVRGSIVPQDGTLCPNCAYSLAGCTGQMCPECGREFTYQELGAVEDRLRSLDSTGTSGHATNGITGNDG